MERMDFSGRSPIWIPPSWSTSPAFNPYGDDYWRQGTARPPSDWANGSQWENRFEGWDHIAFIFQVTYLSRCQSSNANCRISGEICGLCPTLLLSVNPANRS